ncbi:hypothetical protein D3C76_1599850 [compost metagenome]
MEQAQVIANPLDRVPRCTNDGFQGVGYFPADAPADREHQAILCGDWLLADIHEHGCPRAIGRFGHACLEAVLSEQSGLRIADNPGNRYRVGQQL